VTLQRGIDITKVQQRSGVVLVISSGGVSSLHNEAAVSGPGVVLGRTNCTFHGDGAIEVSGASDSDARAGLGLQQPFRVRGLADGHCGYPPWHRQRMFNRGQEGAAG
jgi:hypothetical protein